MSSLTYITSGDHRLAYHRHSAAQTKSCSSFDEILFLGGFMSDMQGSKALFLEKFCIEHAITYTRFDYMGHGQSDGEFIQGNIGLWIDNTLDIIDNITSGKLLVIGSSMGGWIMLHAALKRLNRIHALLGIAAAPDFTEDLIWENLSSEQKHHLTTGKMLDMSGDCHSPDTHEHPFPITMQLIDEGRSQLLLRDKDTLNFPFPVRLLHGLLDDDVPYQVALRLLESIQCPDARLTLDNNGDHRMSTPGMLTLLEQTVKEIMAIS